ncbi:hypothetical protein C241_19492 [Bradyrhizobium lupini HPC(L)]|uniref:Uncharacterized protein n=1 Tax=Bradyrhizobium lupini HPC(L) TaxID=1229491 RepID=A0ABP2RN20_RHILU|nr:hypothetical protein C241_19492 [Bradyrhizobium lupini HPC(L)]
MDETAPLADTAVSTEVPISFPESAEGYEMRLPETFEFPENTQFGRMMHCSIATILG